MGSKVLRLLITLSLVIVLGAVFAITAPYFLTARNISQLFRDSAYIGLVAVGVSFVIIGGGIDLSVGGIICVTAVLTARISLLNVPGFVLVVCALAIGGIFGMINAFLVTKLSLTEFVATLASGFVYSGLALILGFRAENGALITKAITNTGFLSWGKGIGSVYYISIVWIVVTILAYFIITRTRFGRHTYAIGSSARSAQMSGVDLALIKNAGFIISGCCAGLCAALTIAFQSGASASLGKGAEFQAIAACVIGGCLLGGGKGNSVGAFLGALFLSLILNGLYKFGISSTWQYVFMGAIILVATAFDAWFTKFTSRRLIAKERVRREHRIIDAPEAGEKNV